MFISQNILGHLFKCLLSLKTLAQTGAEKFIIEFIFGEKERANKWNDKQYIQNSLIHSATFIPKLCSKFQTPKSNSS